MDINQHILPTPDMIRAARGYLNWSQHELGLKCNLSKVSLVGIESGRQKPNHETLKRIADIFLNEGVIFLPEGGFRVEKNIIKVLEGDDCYLRLLEDVSQTVSGTKNEVLYQGADERRSSSEIVARKREMIKNKIRSRYLIANDNSYIMGKLEDYRLVKKDFFMNDDVTVVYADKIAFVFYRDDTKRIIVIKDSIMAESFRKLFLKIWETSTQPTTTTASTRY